MDESITTRQAIALDADRAAARAVHHGVEQLNPHPQGTEAFEVWRAAYQRFLLLHSAPEADGGC